MPTDPEQWTCPKCGKVMHHRKCRGHSKRDGKHCGDWAAQGSDVCRRHGAAAPQVQASAQRRLEEQAVRRAVAVLGLDEYTDIAPDPHTALLEEVHRAARWVAGCELVIAQLKQDELVEGITKTVQTPDGQRVEVTTALNIWLKFYMDERQQLVRAAKAAVDAGVAERAIQLEEAKGRLVAELFARVFADEELALTEDQRHTASVVAARELRHLRVVDGEAA